MVDETRFLFGRVVVAGALALCGFLAVKACGYLRRNSDETARSALGPTPVAASATRPTPTRPERREAAAEPSPTPFESAVSRAVRSVVTITGVVRTRGSEGRVLGSGFFVTDTGIIVTNAHVMDFEGVFVARTHDGRTLNLQERERDRSLDLGLLGAIGDGPFPPLAFGNAKLLTYGDQVWAIGSPLSSQLGFTMTRGIVSNPLRSWDGHSFLQHDAAINPGNSGGPLIDGAGRLVGVNTWKISGQAQGLGFAIPVEVVEEVLRTWRVRR